MTSEMQNQAIAAVEAGDYATARDLFTRAAQAAPDNPLPWLWLSSLATSEEEKQRHVARVLTLEHATRLNQQGIAAFAANEQTAALDLFKQVTQIDPDNQTAWLWVACLSEDAAEQRTCLERIQTINPQSSTALRARVGLGVLAASKSAAPTPPTPPAQEAADVELPPMPGAAPAPPAPPPQEATAADVELPPMPGAAPAPPAPPAPETTAAAVELPPMPGAAPAPPAPPAPAQEAAPTPPAPPAPETTAADVELPPMPGAAPAPPAPQAQEATAADVELPPMPGAAPTPPAPASETAAVSSVVIPHYPTRPANPEPSAQPARTEQLPAVSLSDDDFDFSDPFMSGAAHHAPETPPFMESSEQPTKKPLSPGFLIAITGGVVVLLFLVGVGIGLLIFGTDSFSGEPATIEFGEDYTTLNEKTALVNPKNEFTPDNSIAFVVNLSKPVEQPRLGLMLLRQNDDGTETSVYPDDTGVDISDPPTQVVAFRLPGSLEPGSYTLRLTNDRDTTLAEGSFTVTASPAYP